MSVVVIAKKLAFYNLILLFLGNTPQPDNNLDIKVLRDLMRTNHVRITSPSSFAEVA